MFKKLKMFLVALIMLPCAIFLPACGEPDDPKDPPSNTLTTEQKNTAFGNLKSTLAEDYSEKSANASIVATKDSSSELKSMDFTNSNLDEETQETMRESMAEENEGGSYFSNEIGYKADGSGYLINKYGETKETAKPQSKTYFVKDGTNYIMYELHYYGEDQAFSGASANYVSSDHSKYSAVNAMMEKLEGLPETVAESANFEEFVESMANSYLEQEFSEIEEDQVALDIDMTKENDIYTIAGTCTFTDIAMEMMGLAMECDGVATYTLKFTTDAILEYGLDLDMEMIMEFPDVMMGGEGEGKTVMTVSSDSVDKVVFSETFDDTKMENDFSEYEEEIGEISNARVNVQFVIDGYTYTNIGVDFTEGLAVADFAGHYELGLLSDITWYTDEGCTTAFTGFNGLKSFDDDIKLYAKNVATPTGYACVIETGLFEDEVSYYNIETESVYYISTTADVYLTIDDGERTLYTESTLTLEEGRTYLIEYVSSDD